MTLERKDRILLAVSVPLVIIPGLGLAWVVKEIYDLEAEIREKRNQHQLPPTPPVDKTPIYPAPVFSPNESLLTLRNSSEAVISIPHLSFLNYLE
jgi:hypothetical protein